MKILVFFLILNTIVGTIQAQADSSGRRAIAKIENKQLIIDFQDGRVAGFFQTVGKPKMIPLGMKQQENTCDEKQVMANCQMVVSMATRHIALKWLKNPDAAKIGQVLVLTSNINGESKTAVLEDNDEAFGWYSNEQEKVYPGLFQADRLVCDRLDWTTQLPQKNGHLLVQSWSTEFMFQNVQTGANENQSIGGAFDVEFSKIDNKTLVFANVGAVANRFGGGDGAPYISPQTVNLNFVNKANQECQISFQMDLGNAVAQLEDAAMKQFDPRSERPLTTSSGILGTNDLESSISNMINMDSGYWSVQ